MGALGRTVVNSAPTPDSLHEHKGRPRGVRDLLKKTTIVALIVSVGIAGIGLAWMQHSQQAQDLPYLGKYSESLAAAKVPHSFDLEKMYGTTYPNVEALSVKAGYKITESTLLPASLEVKALMTKGTGPERASLAVVIYGPKSVDYNKFETFADVMDSHGIIILYDKERDGFDIEKWRADFLRERPYAQNVAVNGFDAIGVDGDPERGLTSKLIFHDGRIQIEMISTAYTLPDLLKVASAL